MEHALLISNMILWLLVIVLSIIVFALARQVGVLYERVAPAGALMINKVLKVGELAPRVEVIDINENQPVVVGAPSRDGKSQLIFFLSPDCPVCKTLLPALRSCRVAEEQWLTIMLASDGEVPLHQEFIRKNELEKTPYLLSTELGMTYQISKLPYAVLIDHEGILRSTGLVNSREHLESLFEAKERNVSSIQEYLEQSREAG